MFYHRCEGKLVCERYGSTDSGLPTWVKWQLSPQSIDIKQYMGSWMWSSLCLMYNHKILMLHPIFLQICFTLVKFQNLIISSKNSAKELLLLFQRKWIHKITKTKEIHLPIIVNFLFNHKCLKNVLSIIFKHVRNSLKNYTNLLSYDYLNCQLTG